MRNREIDPLPDDPLIFGHRRADHFRVEVENVIGAERCFQALVRQFHAISFNAREDNFESVPLRLHSMDPNGFARLYR
jgi:hypothetical protein